MKKWLEEFKKFALKGNVLDLAVGVIIGGAFTAIVSCLTDQILQPLLSLVMGTPVEGWTAATAVSSLVSSIIKFLLTAIVLFLIVKAINAAMKVGKKPQPKKVTTKKCPYCMSEIDIGATRCPHCTSELPNTEPKKNA